MTFFVFSVLPAPDSPLRRVSGGQRGAVANLRYEDTLVGAFVDEVPEGLVSHGEDVGFCLFTPTPTVHVDVLPRVDGKWAVGVDCDQEQARVGLCIVSRAHRPSFRGENAHI
jgi:hypothetical protein